MCKKVRRCYASFTQMELFFLRWQKCLSMCVYVHVCLCVFLLSFYVSAAICMYLFLFMFYYMYHILYSVTLVYPVCVCMCTYPSVPLSPPSFQPGKDAEPQQCLYLAAGSINDGRVTAPWLCILIVLPPITTSTHLSQERDWHRES